MNQFQKVESTDADLANRLRDLIHRCRWKLPEAASRMGVSESYVSHLQNGNRTFSEERKKRLFELERTFLSQDFEQSGADSLEESQAHYGRVQIQPRHALPAKEPTAQELTDLALAIIARARLVPGGMFNLARALRRFEKDFLDPIE